MTQPCGSCRFRVSASLMVWAVLLLLGAPLTVDAKIAPPFMVGNFDDRPVAPSLGSTSAFVPFGDRLAVEVEDVLWLTDGTAEGTFPLCDATAGGPSEDCPRVFRVFAGDSSGVFFTDGRRLWHTDGTVEGTLALTDFLLHFGSPPVSNEFLFHSGRGLFFFSVEHPFDGTEPWVSDGTREGTRPLGDLAAGPYSSFVEFGSVLGDRVVFAATDRDRGSELWITDGTPEGTGLLQEIQPGPGGSFPAEFRALEDRVVFVAGEEARGFELWVTDGTTEGTQPLPEIVPGAAEPFLLLARDSAPSGIFFVALVGSDRALWITDGTPEGTRELRVFDTDLGLVELVVAGDRAFFAAADEDQTGIEPWVSDGTPEGTRRLGDLCPGVCSSNPSNFQPFGARVLFQAGDGSGTGLEPWVSDGTPEGTRMLGDLAPGTAGSRPRLLGGDDDRVFFLASDFGGSGQEIWVSEAPFETVARVTDFEPVSPLSFSLSAALDVDLLFLASDAEHGVALWRSDATVEGTRAVRTFTGPDEAGSRPSGLTRLGDRIFFATESSAEPGNPPALWQTRGTPPSTSPVFLSPMETRRPLLSLTPLADRLLFLLPDDQSRIDLWVTEGTAETTRPIAEDVDRFRIETPLPVLGDRVFLLSGDGQPGLWVSDGTAEGTRRLLEIHIQEREAIAVFQDRLFFAGDFTESQGQFELWVSDGTSEGTRPFADLNPDGPSHPRNFTPVGDLLFFTAQGPDGRQLWRTDGTVPGTRRVDLPPEATVGADSLTRLGDRLLFVSLLELLDSEQEFRVGLWSTDGTLGGAVLLTDLVFTKFLPELERIVLGQEMLFLEARNGPTQIWRTDGTPAGTFPSLLVPPGREPTALHGVDGQLMIEAQGPDGPELWWSEVNLFADDLVGAFFGVGEPIRIDQLVVFPGSRAGVGSELWAFETQDFDGVNQPPPKPPGIPEKPDRLEVFPIGTPGPLRLTWRDRSTNETSFVVQAKHPLRPEFETVAVVPAGTRSVDIVIFSILPITFRVRAENGNGASDWSDEASGRTRFDLLACIPSDERLCLLDGRFEVQVHWRDPFNGGDGIGHARPFDFSDDSGTFWFFDRDNVELVVKVLDAQTVNGFYWTFYGALSTVEYWVTVTDLLEGTSQTYHNPPENLCGLGDTQAFPRIEPPALVAEGEAEHRVVLEVPEAVERVEVSSRPQTEPLDVAVAAGSLGTCGESATALCLGGNRYRVEVSWRDPRSGDTGAGFAIPGAETDDSGFFWFFDPENVELVVKVLDARTVNGNVWFFYGALSDVEYAITVTDTVENVARTYRNPAFEICGQADTAAF